MLLSSLQEAIAFASFVSATHHTIEEWWVSDWLILQSSSSDFHILMESSKEQLTIEDVKGTQVTCFTSYV